MNDHISDKENGAKASGEKPIDLDDETHPDNHDWPATTLIEQSMRLVLQHFIYHRKLVFGKLGIAQEATFLGIRDIEKVCDAYDFEEGMPLLSQVKNYETLWNDVLERFEHAGISEKELHKIEAILERIPSVIKRHYDVMLEADQALTELMDELSDEKYEQAFKLTQDVQSNPNPMSRMSQEEYGFIDEPEDDDNEVKQEKSYVITFE